MGSPFRVGRRLELKVNLSVGLMICLHVRHLIFQRPRPHFQSRKIHQTLIKEVVTTARSAVQANEA